MALVEEELVDKAAEETMANQEVQIPEAVVDIAVAEDLELS